MRSFSSLMATVMPSSGPFRAFAVALLRCLRVGHRLVEMLVGYGIDQRVVSFDAVDLGLQHIDRRQLARLECRNQLGDRRVTKRYVVAVSGKCRRQAQRAGGGQHPRDEFSFPQHRALSPSTRRCAVVRPPFRRRLSRSG
jgi:hypothetical protein